MAQTQVYTTLTGTKFAIMDCQGNTRYTLEEKVFHQPDGHDDKSCRKYKSCDGIVWIQYFVYKDAQLVAQTPYLHIFEGTVQIVDPKTGLRIATATRMGNWDPSSTYCTGDRRWHLSFAPPEEQPATVFATATEQWPLAAMLSIIAQRDASRRPSGLVTPSLCEFLKAFFMFSLAAVTLGAVAVGALVFLRDVVPPLTAALYDFESRVFRRRMYLPSKYGGP